MKWSKAKIHETCQSWREGYRNFRPGYATCRDDVPDTLFVAQLITLGACTPAIIWVGNRTARQAWEECPRLDWMEWLHETLVPNTYIGPETTTSTFRARYPFETLRAASAVKS